MTNFIRTRITRPVMAGLVALILLGSIAPILQAGGAEAHSAPGIPTHEAGRVGCGTGTFGTMPPRIASVSGTAEVVFWQPILFQATTQGWVAVQYHNWAWASADRTGTTYISHLFGNWFDFSLTAIEFRSFSGLTPGWYAVKNFYVWQNGTRHEEFSTYCWVS